MRSTMWRRGLAVASAPVLILGFLSVLSTAPAAAYINVQPITGDGYTVILDHFNGSTNGTPFGSLTYASSLPGLGGAAQFGVGKYVRYPLGASYVWSAGQGTVEMWVRPDAPPDAISLTKPTGLLNGNWGYSSFYPPGGHVLHMGFTYPGSGATPDYAPYGSFWPSGNAYSDTAVIPGEWNHLALSWGSAGTKFYINGVLTNGSRTNGSPDLRGYAYLNYWGLDESGQAAFRGAIDEFHVSKTQRSDAYIAEHAGTGVRNGTFFGWEHWSTQYGGSGTTYWDYAYGPYQNIPAPPAPATTAGVLKHISGPGVLSILYQDVALAPSYRHTLNVDYYRSSQYCPWISPDPDSLSTAYPFQQFRIEVIDPVAPLTTVSPGDIIATLVRTSTGMPGVPAGYQSASAPLPESLAGGVVRIRVVVVEGACNVMAGVTNIAITSTPIPTSVSTTTTLASTATAMSTYGEQVDLAATVASDSGTPTGGVVFKKVDGLVETEIGSDTLADGVAHMSLPGLPVGSYTFKAYYSGAEGLDPSDGTLSHTVEPAPTTTQITTVDPASPVTWATQQTFTATVAAQDAGLGTPTGSVQFQVDYATDELSYQDVGSPVGLVTGQASTSLTLPAAATAHDVRAWYIPPTGGNFAGSTEADAVAVSVQVNKASTQTAIGAVTSPVTHPTAQTFTATVTAVSPGTGTPTGTVQFTVDDVNLDTAVTLTAAGTAEKVITLPPGDHDVGAVYSGDGTFTESTALPRTVVVQRATATTLASSDLSTVYGESVTLTAHVTPTPGTSPYGSVSFYEVGTSDVLVGTDSVDSAGDAHLTTSAFGVGSHIVRADYSGQGYYLASDSEPVTQTVAKASTTTAISPLTPAAVTYPATQSFTVTVDAVAPGAGTPTGSVQFKVDGVDDGAAVALTVSGTATRSIAADAGTHTVSAVYAGNGNFTGSSTTTNATLVVDKAATTVAYTGGYTAFHEERVTLSAQLSSAASTCLTGRTVTFVVSLGAEVKHQIAAEHGTSGKYAPPAIEYADWGEAEIYDVRVVVAESTNCLGTSTAAGDDVITVAERGDAATGGGWYQLEASQGAQKRMNFGFTARFDRKTELYKGNLLLINKQAWRLKGAIDWYGIAGTSPLTAGASGSGILYEADCTTVLGVTNCEWINPHEVTFSIAFTDVASGKSGKRSETVDKFALTNISWAPAETMESGLLPLKGGNITIATTTAPKR